MPGLVSTGMGDCIWIQLCAGNFSRSNQPPRLTQPIHPFVGRCNEYWPKGSKVLQLGSKGRYGSCLVAGKTV